MLETGWHDLRFNHRLQGDTVCLDGRSALNMAGDATRFYAAVNIKALSTAAL